MFTKEELIKTIDLENGRQLKFYDGSRRLAGDRWLISLIVRMDIPVKKILIPDNHLSMNEVDEIVDVLGENIRFEQKRERLFVGETEKETVYNELYVNFLNSTRHYLSRKAFPKQYILKKYREEVKKRVSYH